ncbi:Dimethylaniline monooxygenase [N-oxide-forming] 5 [Gracilariopsis chorda]|uniref:Dimethylaniline monooxygenase [N-oxide-forming] 5 n=1 Tax=Gracilariopsis chorda TaxID=448386 RepID=A0A2V3IMG2_9FLOR|nr:Dimethylaniline monooxygenase [N-oxide-forming] 5 [Gracilariopsis chorda]|eukprot:PXF43273.1 Dimethylaniline monooxygenase [N-oxide-forming] 5 [Gracilariopsis chorda]
MTKVAVVGCGISGICAARACLEEGLDVTVFESRTVPGGVWSKQHTPIFDNLTTNTAVFEMSMSDIVPQRMYPSATGPHDDLCFSKQEMFDYLQRVVKQTPRLSDNIVLGATVTSVSRFPDSTQPQFQLHVEREGEPQSVALFDHVIVATGVFDNPFLPSPEQLPGIDTHSSKLMHVSSYQNPAQVRGKRVLVVGGSLSGMEAVADMLSAPECDRPSHVTISSRIMRRIVVKQRTGRLFLSDFNTRFCHLRILAERITFEGIMNELQLFTVDHDEIDAPPPNVPLVIPPYVGVTLVKGTFINAAKTGRLSWNIGGLKAIIDDGVVFKDDTSDHFDVIVFASGYKTKVPCLSSDMQQLITADDGTNTLELYRHTFHPDLPGVSFVGFLPPSTASIPMYDNQSRWVAAAIAGKVGMPDPDEMREAIEVDAKNRRENKAMYLVGGFEVLDLFAEHGGFGVDLCEYPELAMPLLLGPLAPSQFRMFGRGKLPDAKREYEKQVAASGIKLGSSEVDQQKLEEMKIVTDILEGKGLAPKGLRKAVSYLETTTVSSS